MEEGSEEGEQIRVGSQPKVQDEQGGQQRRRRVERKWRRRSTDQEAKEGEEEGAEQGDAGEIVWLRGQQRRRECASPATGSQTMELAEHLAQWQRVSESRFCTDANCSFWQRVALLSGCQSLELACWPAAATSPARQAAGPSGFLGSEREQGGSRSAASSPDCDGAASQGSQASRAACCSKAVAGRQQPALESQGQASANRLSSPGQPLLATTRLSFARRNSSSTVSLAPVGPASVGALAAQPQAPERSASSVSLDRQQPGSGGQFSERAAPSRGLAALPLARNRSALSLSSASLGVGERTVARRCTGGQADSSAARSRRQGRSRGSAELACCARSTSDNQIRPEEEVCGDIESGVAISVTDTSEALRASKRSSSSDSSSSQSSSGSLASGLHQLSSEFEENSPASNRNGDDELEPQTSTSIVSSRSASALSPELGCSGLRELEFARRRHRQSPAAAALASGRPMRHHSVNERPHQLYVTPSFLLQHKQQRQQQQQQQQQHLLRSPSGSATSGAPTRRPGSHSPSRFNFGG